MQPQRSVLESAVCYIALTTFIAFTTTFILTINTAAIFIMALPEIGWITPHEPLVPAQLPIFVNKFHTYSAIGAISAFSYALISGLFIRAVTHTFPNHFSPNENGRNPNQSQYQ